MSGVVVRHRWAEPAEPTNDYQCHKCRQTIGSRHRTPRFRADLTLNDEPIASVYLCESCAREMFEDMA